MMKSRLFLCCFMLCLYSWPLYSQDLRLASDDWPPFTQEENKKAIALDLVNEALARNGVQAETVIAPFTGVIRGIRDGSFDGSAALWYSEERAEYLHFSDAYLENRLILLGTKGKDVSARSTSDLAGKKIAIVGHYAYGKAIDSVPGLEVVSGANDQENLSRLLAGEVDYMLADALLVQYLLSYHEAEVREYLVIGQHTLFKRSLHFALRKELANAEEIIHAFNEEIRKMILDGTYHRILELNWIEYDVNGDGQYELVLRGRQAGREAPAAGYTLLQTDQPSGTGETAYYIEGNLYNSWTDVPPEYKVPYVHRDELNVGLRFNF